MFRALISSLVASLVAAMIFFAARFFGAAHVTALLAGAAIVPIGFGNDAKDQGAGRIGGAAYLAARITFVAACVGFLYTAYLRVSSAAYVDAVASAILALIALTMNMVCGRLISGSSVIRSGQDEVSGAWTAAAVAWTIIGVLAGWHWKTPWPSLGSIAAYHALVCLAIRAGWIG